MCFDSARNALILFGGQGEGSFDVTNSTYEILYQDEPVVLKQPTVQYSLPGQNTKLTVLAAGAPMISYQWQKDGVNLTDTAQLQGSTSATLQLTSVGAGDGGVYSVVLSNLCGLADGQPIQLIVSTGQISMSRGAAAGDPLMISWPNPGLVLQNAPTPAGPWTDVPGATSPFAVVIGQQPQFFHVRN